VDITSDLECQHRGGTCEFFFGCWVTGGLLQGTCNGLLRGCCHRTAKSANLGTSELLGRTVDLTDLPNKIYGPVKNDASECEQFSSSFNVKFSMGRWAISKLQIFFVWLMVQYPFLK